MTIRAFSSEVDIGSREENASKQKDRAPFRCTRNGKGSRRSLQSIGRITGAIALVTGGWLAVVVALTFGSPPGKSMAIIGPPSQALAAVARANGRILASSDYVTIARSDDAGFVAQLYAAGALLVLDAEQAGGCNGLPLRRPTAQL
jgi:hypothetical protein